MNKCAVNSHVNVGLTREEVKYFQSLKVCTASHKSRKRSRGQAMKEENDFDDVEPTQKKRRLNGDAMEVRNPNNDTLTHDHYKDAQINVDDLPEHDFDVVLDGLSFKPSHK